MSDNVILGAMPRDIQLGVENARLEEENKGLRKSLQNLTDDYNTLKAAYTARTATIEVRPDEGTAKELEELKKAYRALENRVSSDVSEGREPLLKIIRELEDEKEKLCELIDSMLTSYSLMREYVRSR